MAICLQLSTLSKSLKEKLRNELIVTKKKDQFETDPAKIKVYSVEDDFVYIPMSMYKSLGIEFPKGEYPKTNIKFVYNLYTKNTDPRMRDQDVVAKEISEKLDKNHTAFASCHTGFGKCLVRGTRVLLFGGGEKKVEDIVTGDLLIGDDNSPRKVRGTCSGFDKIYKIETESGKSYSVNSSHILTLSNNEGELLDIHIQKYLNMKDKLNIRSVSSVVEYKHTCFAKDLYFIGKDIAGGRVAGREIYSDVAHRVELLAGIIDSTLVRIENDKYHIKLLHNEKTILNIFHSLGVLIQKIKDTNVYKILGSSVVIPCRLYPFINEDRKSRFEKFTITQIPNDFYHGFELSGNGRFVLSNGIITHNTTLGTYFMAKLKLKTVLICDRVSLRSQWKDEIEKFTGNSAKVQIVKNKIDKSNDIFIMGVQQTSKLKPDDVEDIGFVVVDEAHMSTVTCFTKSLLNFQPRYLLGLSATPDRKDGLHSILELYFGPMREFVIRAEKKQFSVIKYKTSYVPDIEYRSIMGNVRPDWNKIMTSIAENTDRHEEIAQIAIDYPTKKIIILCNRVSCTKGIYDCLKNKGESVDWLCGKKNTWDETCRILVAGVSKAGTGLNNTELNMLILEADMKDVRQCEGRIRTTENIVYDIVDDYKTFENHWTKRKTWYKRRGAQITEKKVENEIEECPRFLF